MNNEWDAYQAFIEKTCATDFSSAQDEIDSRLAADAPDHPDSVELRRLLRESERSSEVATALLLVLELCLPSLGNNAIKMSEKVVRVAGTKLITLLWMLRSERLNLARIGQTQIAEGLGCTRALVSHYARFWNKATGLRCRQQKLASASDAYRAASARGWATRRGEVTNSEDALDHTGEDRSEITYCHDESEADLTDDYLPSWNRGRGEDDLSAIAD
jgi:hypothetical protein